MTSKPIIIFDTSAINCLAKEPSWQELIIRLHSCFDARISLICLQELLANPTAEQRAILLAVSKALLIGGDCIFAFEPLLKKHIQAFERGQYNWLYVDVFSEWCRNKILNSEDFTEEFSSELLSDGKEGNDKFKNIFKNMKAKFQNIPGENGQSIEDHYGDFSSFVSSKFRNDGTYWVLAANCYKKAVGGEPPSNDQARTFVMACPPLHSYLLAISYSEYQRCITSKSDVKQRKLPGLADTMMAAYLPYCAQFITNDEGQYQCFKSVVSELKLPAQVVKYDDFRKTTLPGTTQ